MEPKAEDTGTVDHNDSDVDLTKPELNARVVRSLTLYFEHRFGAEALAGIFERTGLDPHALDSEHNWVAMAYRDRLIHAMTEYAKDRNFAYYAGCYNTHREVIGVGYSILASFSKPASLYKKLFDLAPLYNQVGDFEVKELKKDSLTCIYRPRSEDFVDDDYGADFRLGQLVAWPRLCGLPDAKADHEKKVVDGRTEFHYVFSWQTPRAVPEPIQGVTGGLAAGVLFMLLDYFGPFEPASPAVMISVMLNFVITGALLGVLWWNRRQIGALQETVFNQQEGMSQVNTELRDQIDAMHDASQRIKALNASLNQKLKDIESAHDELAAQHRTIQAFNETLQEKIDEQTAELQEKNQELRLTNDQLVAVDQTRIRFFAKINHELRTPLQLLDSAVIALLADPDFDQRSPHRHLVETMRQNARRLLKLINELLDLAKIDAGKMRLNYEEIDLNALLTQIAKDIHIVVEKHGLELRTDLAEDPPPIWMDWERIESAVLNLLYNAVKFTPRGGLITLRSRITEKYATISVSDNGPGIDPEKLPLIFDRFADGGNDVARGHPGTGLGLSIVKEIILLHNGDVTVESNAGEGATFTLLLPLGEATIRSDCQERRRKKTEVSWNRRHEGRSGPPMTDFVADLHEISMADFEGLKIEHVFEPQPRIEGRSTVLVIDDEPDILFLLFVHLRKRYNVITASNRVEGLAKARAEMPDLIISDVVMWEQDAGNRLCEALKGDRKTADIPVILMSARADEAVIGDGFEVGADDYLRKPFKLYELDARVKHVIELKQAHRELKRKNAIIERMATTDALTEAYNRHYLGEEGPKIFDKARADGVPLACLMLDIDHFKRFNTEHTHAGGDAALKGFGSLLKAWFDSQGVVARYGGEEFVVLLPNVDVQNAVDLAEVFLKTLRETDIELHNGLRRNVTASIGVAAYPECGVEDYEALLRAADEALFVAKLNRNTVSAAKFRSRSSPGASSVPEKADS